MTRSAVLAALLASSGAPALAQPAADTLPASVARRQIDAFNRANLDAVMALYADDAVMAEFPSGRIIAGNKQAIRDRFGALLRSMPELLPVRVDPRVVDGAFVFEDEHWEAKPGERNRAIWMYEIRGGLIRRAWTVRM